jgi:hypothetical protein
MTGYPHSRRAEKTGRWLGGVVRRLTYHTGAVEGVKSPPLAVRFGLWGVGVAAIGLLILFAFWLAAVVVFAWVALKLMQAGATAKRSRFALSDPHDHRQRLFYDPLSYNDDPDPRFEDK